MDWESVYTGSGTQALGNLANAVMDGVDVKVWYIAGRGSVWVRHLTSVAVAEDEDQGTPVVCGALGSILDTQVDSTTGRDLDRPLATEWQAFNTTGRRASITWLDKSNCWFGFFCRKKKPAEIEDSNLGIAWLVRRGWEKIYEHNADGTPFSGSFEALHFLAQEGCDIKVRYFSPFGSQDVTWFRNLEAVTTFWTGNPTDQPVVSGMVSDYSSTSFDVTPQGSFSVAELEFAEPYARERQIFNTTGKRRIVKFRMSDGRVISDEISGLRVAWFVRRNTQVGFAIDPVKIKMPALHGVK